MPAPEPSIFRRMFRSWTVRGIVLAIAAIYGWFQFNEWRWEKKWERYVAESRARGVKMFIGEFLPKETIPDDENFAATPIWREVFAVGNMDGPIGSKLKAVPAPKANATVANSQTRPARFNLAGWRASLLAAKKLTDADASLTDGAAVLRGLEFLKPQLDEIRASVKRPKVHFPVKWEEGFAARIPHFAPFQLLVRLLAASANAKLAEGDAAGAFEEWRTLWDLAGKLENEPTLIAGLVHVALLSTAITIVWEGIEDHRWTGQQLEAIQELLSASDPIRRGLHCIATERAALNTWFEPKIGKAGALGGLGGGPRGFQWIQSLRARTRNWWRQNQLWLNQCSDEELVIWDAEAEVMPPRSRQFDVNTLSGVWAHIDLGLVMLAAPIYEPSRKKFLSLRATLRMAGLACALERFRLANARYPERLDELAPQFIGKLPHDPCDGQPFRYRLTPEGYLLYSVGTDLKDDGGKVNDIRDSQSGPDWRWWSPER